MIQSIKKITLDVYNSNLLKVVVAKQGDSKSRFLKATITNDGRRIEIPESATVTISAKRSDGEAKIFEGTVNDDGTVTVPLAYWMIELGGFAECEISIIGAAETKLTTPKFIVDVEEAACTDDDISEDENCDILIKLIDEVRELQENRVGFTTDNTLNFKNGVLSVNTTNTVGDNNTLPITSAAVAVTVGNIETILKTI